MKRTHIGIAVLISLVAFGAPFDSAWAQSSWDLIGNSGTDPSQNFVGTTDNAALELRVNSLRALRLEPAANPDFAPNVIGGFLGNGIASGVTAEVVAYTIAGGGSATSPNQVTGSLATIGGGHGNEAADSATVAGGLFNTASGFVATVAGGTSNTASGPQATVAGGGSNTASGLAATVAGGGSNTASGFIATIGGGGSNTASGQQATVAGGQLNTASGWFATVPGGLENTAFGAYSLAAGRRAKALHEGTFVFGDSTPLEVSTTATNQFVLRFANGGFLFTSGDLSSGVSLDPGGSQWNSVSDRAAKRDFVPVDTRALVAKLAEIPIESWSYKNEDPGIRHIGPVAQDFHAAFGVGRDDKHIGTMDQGGVALAAIQGLHSLLQDKEAEIAHLKAINVTTQQTVEELKARLARLEELLAGSPR